MEEDRVARRGKQRRQRNGRGGGGKEQGKVGGNKKGKG